MNVGEVVRVAWQGVTVNKPRSVLTTLGILIGVAAVIILVAVGTGSSRAVQDEIRQLGSNTLTVNNQGDPTVLLARLTEAGVAVRSDGKLLHVDVGDDTANDIVRDIVAELGLGLVRMERQRHRMTEIFTDSPTDQAGVHV